MKFEKASTNVEHLDLDPSYVHRVKNRISRAKKILKKKSSLRDAILLKEIIHRPDDF